MAKNMSLSLCFFPCLCCLCMIETEFDFELPVIKILHWNEKIALVVGGSQSSFTMRAEVR
jgi:hypothetical protein